MHVITEEQSAALITHEMAYEAVREALITASDPATTSFPVVLGHGSEPGNRFTIKSAAAPDIVGLKVGSYWPGNAARGEPRHNSSIFLFDQTRAASARSSRLAGSTPTGRLRPMPWRPTPWPDAMRVRSRCSERGTRSATT